VNCKVSVGITIGKRDAANDQLFIGRVARGGGGLIILQRESMMKPGGGLLAISLITLELRLCGGEGRG